MKVVAGCVALLAIPALTACGKGDNSMQEARECIDRRTDELDRTVGMDATDEMLQQVVDECTAEAFAASKKAE